MTSNQKDDREALARLAATLTEDILHVSDDEFIAELLEEERNPTDEADAMRAVIERAARACGKARLASARAEIAAARPALSATKPSLDVASARRRLAGLLAQGSLQGLSMAARNESDMSDADVFGMLADLEDLGIKSDDTHSDSES